MADLLCTSAALHFTNAGDRLKRKVIIFIAVLTIIFIWINSVVPRPQSELESQWFYDSVLSQIMQWMNHRFPNVALPALTDNTVRKLAHVFEFFLLSVFTSFCWKGNGVKNFYTGFTIAFLDESIQLLSRRGAYVSDVWIDLIGVALGTVVGCALVLLMKKMKRNKK